MQWHRNIKIKGIIVEHMRYKKHHDQIQVAGVADFQWCCSAFRCENKTFQGDKCKLEEWCQIASASIQSEEKKQRFTVFLSKITHFSAFRKLARFNELNATAKKYRISTTFFLLFQIPPFKLFQINTKITTFYSLDCVFHKDDIGATSKKCAGYCQNHFDIHSWENSLC